MQQGATVGNDRECKDVMESGDAQDAASPSLTWQPLDMGTWGERGITWITRGTVERKCTEEQELVMRRRGALI